MLEHRSTAAGEGRCAGSAQGALLSRIQDGLASQSGPHIKVRRCPCCGGPIRAGQRITTIHGTSVHVRCASAHHASS